MGAKKISQEHLAFDQKDRAMYLSSICLCDCCQREGDAGALLLLGFVCLQGLGSGWGLPQCSFRTGSEGLISLPGLLELMAD